jgi:capsid assembly protease
VLDLVGKFLDTAIWALTPDMVRQIYRLYDLHAHGGAPDIAAIEAQLGRPLHNDQPKEYEVRNGVAIIPVTGVIAKRMGLFMAISGGSSTERIAAMFKAALDDPEARAIALVIDSPGGSVDGLYELANLIFTARDQKPCLALAYGCAASAAYLIAAACSEVYASDAATMVGSIGVVMTHRDTSQADSKSGVVTTDIYRGKYKRLVSAGPLSDEGYAHLSEKVDYYFTLFIDEIARFRGVSPDTVLSTMSTDVNDLFIGQQAVDAGLVDGIATLDALIAKALTLSSTGSATYQGITLKSHKEETAMEKITTLAELKAAYPDLAAQARDEGVKSVDQEAIRVQAATAETNRIVDLVTIAASEDQGPKIIALINATTPADQLKAAMDLKEATQMIAATASAAADSAAETAKKEEILAALKTTGAPAMGTDGNGVTTASLDYLTLVENHMALHKCTKLEAMQAVTAKFPDAHKAYIKKANEGGR